MRGSEHVKRKRLPPALRHLIMDLKAEYPRFSLNEIAKICYARFGRALSCHTVKQVLEEEPLPLRMIRQHPQRPSCSSSTRRGAGPELPALDQ